MQEYTNIYYFRIIQKIGGIETFFYQLAKKYKDIDLVIVYSNADEQQLKRLKKYVKCVKYTGQKIKCKKAFFNFNTDIIDNVEAEEYCLVVHGDYRMLKGKPPIHKKINKYYGVSQVCCDSYTELTGLPCELTYNPISKEEYKPLIKLCSACRLDDPVKGGIRTQKLIKALDDYSKVNNVNYMWTIFTNTVQQVDSPNVAYMKPRIDIMPYMLDADYVVQLSDDFEGYNYTVNEALLNNVPVVITPCKVYKELGIDETMSIQLNFDLSNIDEVVEKIFTSKLKVKYEVKEDNWKNILINKKSKYKEDKDMKVVVKCIKHYMDMELKEEKYPESMEYIVDKARAEYLVEHKVAEIVREIKEEPIIETKPIKTTKVSTAKKYKRRVDD